MSMDGIATFHTDDAPDGEGPVLEVFAGGNGDWYVTIRYRRPDGLWCLSDGVRFCTSGSGHSPEIVNAVALLGFLGAGQKARARTCAEAIVAGLQTPGTPKPPKDGER